MSSKNYCRCFLSPQLADYLDLLGIETKTIERFYHDDFSKWLETSDFLKKPDPVYKDADPNDKNVDPQYAPEMRKYHEKERKKAIKFLEEFPKIRLFDSIDGEGERNSCLYMLCPTKSGRNEFVLGTTDYGWGTPLEAVQALEDYKFNIYEFLQFDRLSLEKATRKGSPYYTHFSISPSSKTGKLLDMLKNIESDDSHEWGEQGNCIAILPNIGTKNSIVITKFDEGQSSVQIESVDEDNFDKISKIHSSTLDNEQWMLLCRLLPVFDGDSLILKSYVDECDEGYLTLSIGKI